MLFALLGGHVDGTVTHQYQAPRAEQQQQRAEQQQEQGSHSRVPTPHLLYPQLSAKSKPQSAASQDTPLQTPEQSQVVIPADQEGIPVHVSQTASLQVNHHAQEHPGVEMFASDSDNRPVSQGAWMMPVMDSNNGPIVLPLAPPVPTSTPFDGFVSLPGMAVGGMTNDLGMMGMSIPGDFACSATAPDPAAGPAGATAGGDKMTIMDNAPGLWEKLQAFYEPSVPVFWEGNVGGGDVNPGMSSGIGMGMSMPPGGGMGVGAMYGGYAGGGGYGMGVATGMGTGDTATGMNGGFEYPTQGSF